MDYAEVARVLDQAADEAGVSRELVRAVAWIESRWTPTARGKAGERGIMQLMARTAAGTVADVPAEQLDDAAANAAGGARLLRYLLRKFRGAEHRALAAYNWGEGSITHNPDPSDWPPTVRRYVERVQARKLAGVSPDLYASQHDGGAETVATLDPSRAGAAGRAPLPKNAPSSTRPPRGQGIPLPLSSAPRSSRQHSPAAGGRSATTIGGRPCSVTG